MDRRIHLRDAWAVIWEIAIRILLYIGSSNDCNAVGICAKLEQLVLPSPMSFGCALMRPTHTGLRTSRDRLEHFCLNWYQEGCLVKKAGSGCGGSFQFARDLRAIPEPACGSVDPKGLGGFFISVSAWRFGVNQRNTHGHNGVSQN